MSFLSSGMTREKIFGPDPMPADFWNRGGGLLATRPSAIIGASRDLRGQSRELRGMEPGYASLALPIGVLYADDCLLDPKVQGESFCAKAPGAELTRVAGGHMLPVTQPKTCETFIRLVLARL
jgi:hypothetical protein